MELERGPQTDSNQNASTLDNDLLNSIPTDDDPVSELALALGNSTEDKSEYSDIIRAFLKDNNLQIVPVNGLVNSRGDV